MNPVVQMTDAVEVEQGDEAVYVQDDGNANSKSSSTASSDTPSSSSYFFSDENGIIWMFEEVVGTGDGDKRAKITGVYFGECNEKNLKTLEVPDVVRNNSFYAIDAHKKILIWSSNEYSEYNVIELGSFIIENNTKKNPVLNAIAIKESEHSEWIKNLESNSRLLESVENLKIPSSIENVCHDAFYSYSELLKNVVSIDFGKDSRLESVDERAFFNIGQLFGIEEEKNRNKVTITDTVKIEIIATGIIKLLSNDKGIYDITLSKNLIEKYSAITYSIEELGVSGTLKENGNITDTKIHVETPLGFKLIIKDDKSKNVIVFTIIKPYPGLSVTIPDSLKIIGDQAFGDYVTELKIGEGSQLETVGSKAFNLDESISLVLPATMKTIHRDSFGNASFTFKEGSKIWITDGNILKDLGNDHNKLLSYIGDGTSYDFTADGLAQTITEVGEDAFKGSSVSTVKIRNGIAWGKNPFNGLNLSTIDFGDVTEIPDYCFGGITSSKITIPASITEIGDFAFSNNAACTSVVFDDDSQIKTIGKYAFCNNYNLTKVTFGSSDDGSSCMIDEGAFFRCTKLVAVTLDPNFNLTSIGDFAFTKVLGTTAISPIKSFGSDAGINQILIPSEVSYIGQCAFSAITIGNVTSGIPRSGSTASNSYGSNIVNFTISVSFEENSKISTLSKDCFVICKMQKADFSNCGELKSVIGVTTPKELVLPSDGGQLEEISLRHEPASIPEELQTISLPSSVRIVSGLSCQSVTFSEGSMLKTARCVEGGVMDLSNCRQLESVTFGDGNNEFGKKGSVTLPGGIYSIFILAKVNPVEWITNYSSVIYGAGSGSIVIDQNIKALNKDLLGSATVTGGNDAICIIDGLVCYTYDGKTTAYGTATPDISEIEIGKDSDIDRIESGALDNDAVEKTISIGKELDFGDSVLGQPTIPEISIFIEQYLNAEVNKNVDPASVKKCDRIFVDFNGGKWLFTYYSGSSPIGTGSFDGEVFTIYVAEDHVDVEFSDNVARVLYGSKNYGYKDMAIEDGGNLVKLLEHDKRMYAYLQCYSTSVPKAEITLPEGSDFPADAFADSGDTVLTFNVFDERTAEDALELGNVRIGRSIGDTTVFVPYDMDGQRVHINNLSSSDGKIAAEMRIDGGYTLYDIDLSGTEDIEVTSAYVVALPVIKGVVVLDIAPKDRSGGDCKVTFKSDASTTVAVVKIPKGMTIIDAEIPVAVKDNSVFKAWLYGNEAYDFDSRVEGNIILIASWGDRAPIVSVVTEAGDVSINGHSTDTYTVTDSDETVAVRISVYEGYEFLGWTYIQSGEVRSTNSTTLRLTNVTSDVTVSVDYRYYSTSSGLVPIVNRGFPTTDDIPSAVKSWSTGGKMDMSGMNWTGHSSVPLIVDNYVYLRIGDKLCKVESDTGYCVASVPSISQTAFYHQLGYGNGLIVDYATSKVYDTDLKLAFVLDRSITGAEYYEGMFYTSGDNLYSFPADASKANDGTMTLTKIGTFKNKVYSSYGFSSGIFHNGALYRVSAEGSERGIAWMKLDGSAQGYLSLGSEFRDMYMDDGWMSIDGDVLYIGGYTQGLFSTAKPGCSMLAYMRIGADCSISDVKYISYDGSNGTTRTGGYISEFVVSDGIGFVNVGATLYAYRMNGDGTPGEMLASETFTYSHGSIVVDRTHVSEEGSPIYVYMIPYHTGEDSSMAIMKCCWSGGKYTMEALQAHNFPSNYNSQALRAGLDGQMIWYNDSGWVYSYASPEDNRYFLFIRDGDSGRWYESAGASAYAAFSKLGDDVLTFGSMKNLKSVYGGDAKEFSMYVITYGNVSDSTYAVPTEIFDLRDSKNDVYHYYIITDEEVTPSEGGKWSYIDDSMELRTCEFRFNIGDRTLVGRNMAVQGRESVVSFYDGDKLVGKDLGAIGSGIGRLAYPDIVKEGLFVDWTFDSEDGKLTKSVHRMDARWISTITEVKTSTSGGMYIVEAELDRMDGLKDPNVAFVATYGDEVVWTFVQTQWNEDGTYVFKTNVSLKGLTSAKLMFVDGSSFADCRMVSITELAVS